MWFRPYPHFSSNSSTWQPYSAVSPPSWCHPHILTETNPVFDERTYIPNSVTNFVQEISQSLQIYHMILVFQLCRGRHIQTSENSDLGILSNLGASFNFTSVLTDTTSPAWPSRPGNIAITSMIVAAIIWDADEPNFSKNCWSSRVVFYNVQAEHESAFVLRKFLVLTPHFLKRHIFINVAKKTCFVSLCFQNNLLFALDFVQLPSWNRLDLLPFLFHCSFCIRNLHRLCHRG